MTRRKILVKFYYLRGNALTVVHSVEFDTGMFFREAKPLWTKVNIPSDKKMNFIVRAIPREWGIKINVEASLEGLYDAWMDGKQIIFKTNQCNFGVKSIFLDTSKPFESNSKVMMHSP